MKPIKYLIDYVSAQIGRPYWCGTFGQIATEWLYTFNKKRLPAYYTATDFKYQYGKKVHDCCGLIKGAKWCSTVDAVPVYIAADDLSVKGLYDKCTVKGVLSTATKLRDGTLLFRGNFEHVGIYAGGHVIHAKGHAYGVVKEPYVPALWGYYGELRVWFDYSDTEDRPVDASIKVGDTVKLKADATVYGASKRFASYVYDAILYVREVNKNRIVVSTLKKGAITGAVHLKHLIRV